MDGATELTAPGSRLDWTDPAWLDESRDWELWIEQARAFVPDDPTTACHRLRAIRRALRHAIATSSEKPQSRLESLAAYVDGLIARSDAAKRQWLADCAERERQFRLREARIATTPLDRLGARVGA